MIKFSLLYLLIENQEDFDKNYDKKRKELNGNYLWEEDRNPTQFPVVYKYVAGMNPHDLCYYFALSNEEAISKVKELIEEQKRKIEKFEGILKILEKTIDK